MAFTSRVDPAVNCAFIRHFGQFEVGEGLKAVEALVENPLFVRGMHILKDYSELRGTEDYTFAYATTHVHRLRALDERALAPCKIALVAADGISFGLVRQMSMLAGDDAVQREAFTNIEEAAAWLGIPPESVSFEEAS